MYKRQAREKKKQNKALVDDLLADLINTVSSNSSTSSSTPASSSTPNAFTTTSVKKRFQRLHAKESPIINRSRTQLFNDSKKAPTNHTKLFFSHVSKVIGNDVIAQLDVVIAILRQKLVSVPGISVIYSNKSESYSELSNRQIRSRREKILNFFEVNCLKRSIYLPRYLSQWVGSLLKNDSSRELLLTSSSIEVSETMAKENPTESSMNGSKIEAFESLILSDSRKGRVKKNKKLNRLKFVKSCIDEMKVTNVKTLSQMAKCGVKFAQKVLQATSEGTFNKLLRGAKRKDFGASAWYTKFKTFLKKPGNSRTSVSYTHLTLPTKA